MENRVSAKRVSTLKNSISSCFRAAKCYQESQEKYNQVLQFQKFYTEITRKNMSSFVENLQQK